MTGRLTAKRTIITAAGQGIGRATAIAYAQEGADVLATDINVDALAALTAEVPSIRTLRLDVTDGEAIAEIARDNAFDCLVHCAGMVAGGSILDCDEAAWARSWELNVTSAYVIARAVTPGMISRGGGTIVLIGSIASSIVGVPNRFVYGVTKAALIGLTKSVAVDFVREGVRCNIICPGTVHTPSLEERILASPDPKKARVDFINRQPMGRLGRAEEIAAMAVHLGSDESAFTTGQSFILDGGWTAA